MRNLRYNHRSLVEITGPENGPPTACCFDVGRDSIICAVGPSKANPRLEIKRWHEPSQELETIAAWESPCPSPDLDCDSIIDLHYFSDDSSAVVVLAGGDLVVVKEHADESAGDERIEIVGSVDAGITAAAWSPDEELLVILTNASTLLFMTRQFENIANVTLSADDLRVSSHVSVGWGKKETQFHGKKARALRDPTIPERVDEGVLHSKDLASSCISWRGDGAFLAVNSLVTQSRRAIRVYTREGLVDSISEPVDHLLATVAWRPLGNLIAGVQLHEGRAQVIFFERNGLRHGQFDLRLDADDSTFDTAEVTLRWSVDSSVLAVSYKQTLQLWTMGNYHYYLKQVIPSSLSGQVQKTIPFQWHPEKGLCLALLDGHSVQCLSFSSVISSGSTCPPNDDGLVAVIDGKTLKLTPLKQTNMPPPMALHELAVEQHIVDVAMYCSRERHPHIYLSILQINSITLLKWKSVALSRRQPLECWTVALGSAEDVKSHANLQSILSPDLTTTIFQQNQQGYFLKQIKFDGSAEASELLPIDTTIEGLVHNVLEDTKTVHVIGRQAPSKSTCTKSTIGTDTAQRIDYVIHTVSSPPIQDAVLTNLCYANTSAPTQRQHVLFHLDDNGSLFANDRCLLKNCTSFTVTPDHLILTTSRHLLKFVHLASDGVDSLVLPLDTPETDERCRSIERGAKLVTAMPSAYTVVLQMPRGNLETIYPRAMVLAAIRSDITRKEYRKAYFTCRSQRVDMNILHDYAPTQFILDIRRFVEQIPEAEHIDLFLSQLKEEDVSETMYRETLERVVREVPIGDLNSPKIHHTGGKVNQICDAMLKALEGQTGQIQRCVITAHVCKLPPDLEAGLLQIARLKRESSDQVERSVEHICFLADVNKLYESALGLYDLQLALYIAERSQKDPREYIAFLQGLQDLPDLRRRFAIDDHLERRIKALTTLYELQEFEEVKAYVTAHGLYLQSLDLYRRHEDEYRILIRLYADHLKGIPNAKEAAIFYEYLQDYATASACYCQAHLWRESLSCALLGGSDSAEIEQLALSLVDMMNEVKDYNAVAELSLHHLDDTEAGLRAYCRAYNFSEAIRVACQKQRREMIETVVDPGIMECMGILTEFLAECKAQLGAQVPRIAELRVKKAADPLAFLDGDVTGGPEIPDDISIATTEASTMGGSLFTRYTNRSGTVGTNATRRTSKNRRREERKRAQGKKGSVYEEEYLVNSVQRLVERVNAQTGDIGRLVEALMRRGMRERSRVLEAAAIEVHGLCHTAVAAIWKSQPLAEAQETYQPEGAEAVLRESLAVQNTPQIAPVVQAFACLSVHTDSNLV